MRPIDADKIVEVAEHAWGEWNLAMATQDTNRGVNKVLKMQELCKTVKAVADDCPTINLESLRPHGRWKVTHALIENAVCSNCGAHFQAYYAGYPYCPRCGAKMDGEVLY